MLFMSLASCQNETKNQSKNSTKNNMEQSTEKTAIEKLLFSYRDALNVSDVNKVLPLYTSDGVFMPSNAPSAIGLGQIKGSYEFVFKTIQLKSNFILTRS